MDAKLSSSGLGDSANLSVSLLEKLDVLKFLMKLLVESLELILSILVLSALLIKLLSLFRDYLVGDTSGCRWNL